MTIINIPKKIEKKLQSTSRQLGISKEDFLLNATLYYFKALRERINLKKELDIWQKTSDNDLIKKDL